jgi:hypothetical protein
MTTETNPLGVKPPQQAGGGGEGPKSKEDLFKPWLRSDKTKDLRVTTKRVPYPILKGKSVQKIDREVVSVYEEDGQVVFVVGEDNGKDEEKGVEVAGQQYVVKDIFLRKLAACSPELNDFLKQYISEADAKRFPKIAPQAAAPPPKRSDSRAGGATTTTTNVPFGPALVQLATEDLIARSNLPPEKLLESRDVVATMSASVADGYYEFVGMNANQVREKLNMQFLEEKKTHPNETPKMGNPGPQAK